MPTHIVVVPQVLMESHEERTKITFMAAWVMKCEQLKVSRVAEIGSAACSASLLAWVLSLELSRQKLHHPAE